MCPRVVLCQDLLIDGPYGSGWLQAWQNLWHNLEPFRLCLCKLLVSWSVCFCTLVCHFIFCLFFNYYNYFLLGYTQVPQHNAQIYRSCLSGCAKKKRVKTTLPINLTLLTYLLLWFQTTNTPTYFKLLTHFKKSYTFWMILN